MEHKSENNNIIKYENVKFENEELKKAADTIDKNLSNFINEMSIVLEEFKKLNQKPSIEEITNIKKTFDSINISIESLNESKIAFSEKTKIINDLEKEIYKYL